MFLVCHLSMNVFSDPVLHAPLEGVVGGPALSMAHWYPAVTRTPLFDALLHHEPRHQEIRMLKTWPIDAHGTPDTPDNC